MVVVDEPWQLDQVLDAAGSGVLLHEPVAFVRLSGADQLHLGATPAERRHRVDQAHVVLVVPTLRRVQRVGLVGGRSMRHCEDRRPRCDDRDSIRVDAVGADDVIADVVRRDDDVGRLLAARSPDHLPPRELAGAEVLGVVKMLEVPRLVEVCQPGAFS